MLRGPIVVEGRSPSTRGGAFQAERCTTSTCETHTRSSRTHISRELRTRERPHNTHTWTHARARTFIYGTHTRSQTRTHAHTSRAVACERARSLACTFTAIDRRSSSRTHLSTCHYTSGTSVLCAVTLVKMTVSADAREGCILRRSIHATTIMAGRQGSAIESSRISPRTEFNLSLRHLRGLLSRPALCATHYERWRKSRNRARFRCVKVNGSSIIGPALKERISQRECS